MMIRLLLSILIVTKLFAIHDMLLRPQTGTARTLSYIQITPLSLATPHFIIYYGDETQYQLANDIAQIAEYVWQKEVVEFGFQAPTTTTIDIYLANSGLYNRESGEAITIPSYFSGYASYYSDGTPYFVINPDIWPDILKVTIAHEFFHTIQFAYGFFNVDDRLWNENLWFLEASATYMEDLLYDDINDYINFLDYYLPYTYFPLDYTNGGIEYGKAIFVRFFCDQLGGTRWLKDFFSSFDLSKNAIENLKIQVPSFETQMMQYGLCLAHLSQCFPDEPLTQQAIRFSIEENRTIGYYGTAILIPSSAYVIAPNPSYLHTDTQGQTQTIAQSEEVVITNIHNRSLPTSLLRTNQTTSITLQLGWNLVSNIFNNPIDLEQIEADIVWTFRDGRYYGYSNNNDLQELLRQNGYLLEDTTWYPRESLWIYTSSPTMLTLPLAIPITYDTTIVQDGWNFVTLTSTTFYPQDITEPLLIWGYHEGQWKVWGSEFFDVEPLEVINAAQGFFIKKLP